MLHQDPAVGAANAEGDATVPGDERASGSTDESRLLRLWRDIRYPVLCFLTIAVVLYLTVFLSNELLTRNPHYPIKERLVFRGAGALEGWVRYDGGWYRLIASDGYNYVPGAQSSVAFFPAYPMSMRFVGYLTGDVVLAGIMITFTCGLGAAILMYRWCCRVLSVATARVALLFFLLFPYAWYVYGAVYADALFLCCTFGAFVLLERDKPVLAGLLAAIATAARPIGIGVIIGMLAVLADRRGVIVIPYLDRVRERGWRNTWREARGKPLRDGALDVGGEPATKVLSLSVRLRRLRPKDAGVFLAGGGLAAWCTYLWVTYGSPFIFSDIEGAPGWDQAQGPRTWFKIHWLGLIHHFPEYANDLGQFSDKFIYTLDVSFQGALAIGCLLLIPLVVRRIGWSYAVYTLAVVMLPVLGTKDWQGTGRYLLAAFPVFAALADWLVTTDRRRLRIALTAVSAATLVFLTSGYARGYYLA